MKVETGTEAVRSDRYLILKRGLYYRPDECGYTGIKDHAGRYSLFVAKSIAAPNGPDGPADGITFVHEDDAKDFTDACFDDLKAAHLEKKITALAAANEALVKERDVAQSACTAWQEVFGTIEAHLQDRIAMNDAAAPQRYLGIIRGAVEDVDRGSRQIVASRWHERASLVAERDAAHARAERLEGALSWYGEQVRLCRLIHSGGDAGRHALADDGGKRARAALATQEGRDGE